MESIIAANIKRIIAEKGLKQQAVAERAKIHPNTFSNMLNSRKLIVDFHIPLIANALGVTPNDLFGFSDNGEAS